MTRTTYPAAPATHQGSGTIRTLLLAGLAGQVLFETVALALMPALFGMPLMPALLVVALGQTLLGIQLPMLAGWIGHLLAEIVIFPLGWLALRGATGWSASPPAPRGASPSGSSRRARSHRSPDGPSCSASSPTPGLRWARISPTR
jgi:hypothetical protein